jgi:hypothetical protein
MSHLSGNVLLALVDGTARVMVSHMVLHSYHAGALQMSGDMAIVSVTALGDVG